MVEASTTQAKTVRKTTVLEFVKTRSAWTFLYVTSLFLGVVQSIMPHLKEGSLGYLLIQKILIFFKQIGILNHNSE